jgi:hypothetical protein
VFEFVSDATPRRLLLPSFAARMARGTGSPRPRDPPASGGTAWERGGTRGTRRPGAGRGETGRPDEAKTKRAIWISSAPKRKRISVDSIQATYTLPYKVVQLYSGCDGVRLVFHVPRSTSSSSTSSTVSRLETEADYGALQIMIYRAAFSVRFTSMPSRKNHPESPRITSMYLYSFARVPPS